MEEFLSQVIMHDSFILTFLVAGIGILLLILLLINFTGSRNLVLTEYGKSEEFERTLRRVLGDGVVSRSRVGGASGDLGVDGEGLDDQISALESQISTKDKEIEELKKQLAEGGGGASGEGEDSAALHEKIKDLEARLEEYAIIEDDIADLSVFKTENEKLKSELNRLKTGGGESHFDEDGEPEPPEEIASEPVESSEPLDRGESLDDAEIEEAVAAANPDELEDEEDYVAEFEKILNEQAPAKKKAQPLKIESEASKKGPELGSIDVNDGEVSTQDQKDFGDITLMKENNPKEIPKAESEKEDSKIEAEELIGDFQGLKEALGGDKKS